ncbi:hypothetical protein EFR01_04790 [Sinorhizobium fredii]|nr:hypothetical protein EFR01_04790 [Sinorhizobium fredii]GLS09897.1 hypothetical protein GCM10007864_35280 [Sinorhizobium fredii]
MEVAAAARFVATMSVTVARTTRSAGWFGATTLKRSLRPVQSARSMVLVTSAKSLGSKAVPLPICADVGTILTVCAARTGAGSTRSFAFVRVPPEAVIPA